MAVKTIPFREIEKITKDMYEATVVISKRSRQIVADRSAELDLKKLEQEPGLLEESSVPQKSYPEKEKATTVALSEFLKKDLEWKYPQEESSKSGDEGENR